MAWLPFTPILYHISIYMSRALFYFFRLPLSWLSVNRFNYYHFTPNIIHLFKLLVKSFFFPFRLPFKVVGGFGLGLTATLSIIYTNIISYFLRLVKAFNFPFRLPWLSLWFALITIFLSTNIIPQLLLYVKHLFHRRPSALGAWFNVISITSFLSTNIIHLLHLKVKR